MRMPARGLALFSLVCAALTLQAQVTVVPAVGKPAKAVSIGSTHEQVKEIAIKGSNGHTLQTLCADNEGRILALAAPARGYGAPIKNAAGEIQIITADGKAVKTFNVEFHAQSLNVGPDGTIFVAGDGKVAKFDRDGKQLALIELPHIAELLKDTAELRKRAEQQVKQQKESFASIVKQMQDRKAKLELKKAEDRTAQEKLQLQQTEQVLESYKQSQKYYDNITVDSVVGQLTGRLRVINGVALSEKDLFIVCGETKGYGYAIWRMGHDFKNAKQVLSGVGGCCGQMDIQVSGSDFLLAENTRHRFARYGRDGKLLGGFGEKGRESDGKCFGGCCNPMNLRVNKGDVYTAESEGVIKRFNDKGEFVSLVGQAQLKGGCKNVAVAVTKDGKHVYFCDLPGSRVIVLAAKSK